MEEQAVRWSIKVSKDTDLTLRTFLGSRGMKKGDLSKFTEEAVRLRVLQRTVQDIRARNAGTDPDEIQRVAMKPSARSARNAAPEKRLTEPDARGYRYQHPRVRPDRPGRQARRYR